ncbi:DUF5977 domain-containing protein [Flavobacterium notoginsengisoli]|uniref:DUF5977 domain-containing protein n=1 Tax=Flavobacterium notoginsengisoli TaxID=1478199 RepID=UPI0036338DE5
MEENTTYKPFAYQENYIPAEGETVFYNTEQTLTKIKNDCAAGIPSSVTLTAQANKFVSNESVDKANEQAESWLKTNSQAYANNSGTCFIDTIPPSSVILSASNITLNSVVLSWTEATDNIAVVGYDIFIDDTFLASVSNTVFSHTIDELLPSTAYSFYVKAKDAAGNPGSSNVLTVTTLPLKLTLKAARSVIFEKKDSSWNLCKNAASAELQHTNNNVIGGGKNAQDFYLNRYRGVIDTSSITTKPKTAKIKFKFAENTVGNALTFNLFGANIQIPVNQNFQLADWNDWDSSTFINSVSVPVNSTAENQISLNSSQLDLLLSQAAFNFFLISNGDKGNVEPSTNNRPTLSITPATGEVYLECEF